MQKLKLHTPDLTAANIDRIAALFPNCVTETKDESGKPKRAIDFDLLRQELSETLVEGPQERYRLDWPGKREALALANQPITKTLRPCREESVDFENTKNLYIEGDNLDALKLLQETYLGKVKMIYIDPPYNTGNDFIYDDNFSMSKDQYEEISGDRDTEGNAMFDAEKWKLNSSSDGRFHSEWLSMIYPRLRFSKNLLADDGVIFISIDDCEYSSLKLLLDEIFGSLNFVSTFVWRRSGAGGLRGSFPITNHEYILAYAKDSIVAQNNTWYAPYSDSADEAFDQKDERGQYKTQALYLTSLKQTEKQSYGILLPNGELAFPPKGIGSWRFIEETYKEWFSSGKIIFKETKTSPLQTSSNAKASYNIYTKQYRDEKGSNPSTWLSDETTGQTRSSKAQLNELFQTKAIFDYAKPPKVVLFLMNMMGVASNDIILDFFSGSATTAHAVMQLNAEDGGQRRHIMVQLPEPCDEKGEAFKAGYKTIAEIGKERIRRAGQKILQEWQAKQAKEQPAQGDLLSPENLKLKTENSGATAPDVGFRVLKISDSNFREIERTPEELDQKELALHTEHIKPDRTPEDLLFQVLVDWGVDLALPIVSETLHGKRVFFVDDSAEPAAHPALAACFDTGLSDELVHAIAARKPLRAVFRDDGFGDDSTRINVEQIFKLLSPNTEVKAL